MSGRRLTPALLQSIPRVSEWPRRLELFLKCHISPHGNSTGATLKLALLVSTSREMLQFLSLTTSSCVLISSFHHQLLLLLRYLVLSQVSVLCLKDVELEAAVGKYNADLSSPELFEMELKRWKSRYMSMPSDLRPASPAEAIKECDCVLPPNIRVLLQIACTIPVTSCECERSASVLRLLNNYMRASMGQSRLSYLALLHIHYDTLVDLDVVVDCYARLHPRRLALDSLLC